MTAHELQQLRNQQKIQSKGAAVCDKFIKLLETVRSLDVQPSDPIGFVETMLRVEHHKHVESYAKYSVEIYQGENEKPVRVVGQS